MEVKVKSEKTNFQLKEERERKSYFEFSGFLMIRKRMAAVRTPRKAETLRKLSFMVYANQSNRVPK